MPDTEIHAGLDRPDRTQMNLQNLGRKVKLPGPMPVSSYFFATKKRPFCQPVG